MLVRSVSVLAGIALLATLVYFWQSSSMASELLEQAKSSDERGENKEKVKWLTRYVRLVPSDVKSLAELAFAVDTQESGPAPKIEYARSRLAAALVACGEASEYEELRKLLRRKLVPRLLQYGSSKATEVEEQIMLLQAPEGDAEVTKWLAQSLVMQRAVSEFQDRDASSIDKSKDYWRWLAAQPAGQVLQIAVQANPADVETATLFLNVFNQRLGWFGPTTDVSQAETQALAKQTLDRLVALKDDGRAQLVAYSSIAMHDKEKANSMLKEALEPAFTRLSQFAKDLSKDIQPSSDASDPKTSDDQVYTPTWDWQIALENSMITSSAEAEAICQRLIDLANSDIGDRQIESAFERLATLKFEQRKFDEVVTVCKSGLATVKQSSGLNRLIASASIQQGKTKEAKAAISEIEGDTESRLRGLDGVVGLTMSSDEKAAARQQIATEQWVVNLMKAQLAIAEKDFRSALKLLQNAFTTTLPILSEGRVEAGQLLATCYSQVDQWDSAAQVLSACAALKPNDRLISLNAARAWRRAGSSERASEQMGNADDGSYLTAMENAMSIASKPAAQVDRRAIAAALKTARSRFDALSAEQQASLEPWKLELFEARVGGDESDAQRDQENDVLGKLELLAEKYADVAELQSQVAVEFAAFGRAEAASKPTLRLEQIAERSQKVEDRVNLELVKARVCFVKKDKEGALAILQNAMKTMPDQSLAFAKVAAQIEIRENRIDQAFELLSAMPDKILDFDAMVILAGIADSLRISNPEKVTQLSSRFEGWIDSLKKSEGLDGTTWRYLAAERLVARFALERNNRQLLDEALTYYKEIDARRPHWGIASALGGKIASLRSELDRQVSASEEAIALWRRAIRDGDIRVSTVMDLVRELNLLQRPEEANAEFQRISSLSDSLVDVSRMAVSSALERGNFGEALAIAERLTARNPDDVEAWILRAKTLFAASMLSGIDAELQAKRRAESWNCLDEAFSRNKGISVWDARFRFKVQTGDKEGASAIVEDMLKELSLPEEVRFLEAGRRYLVLKEFGLCRRCLEDCLLLNPRSADVHTIFADMYREIGDPVEFLSSLRKANKAAPKSQSIRERLALAIAFSKAESTENELREIDALLASSELHDNSRSTIVRAWIALRRGDIDRQSKAVETLEQLANSNAVDRLEAKRMLGIHFVSQYYAGVKSSETKRAMDSFESSKELYEELLSEANINAEDATRYVNLLLSVYASEKNAGQRPKDDYLAIAERVISQLEAASGNSVASLQLRIRLLNARGDYGDIENVVNKWVKGAENLRSFGEQYPWEIAGMALMDFGHSDKAISWLEKVYEKDPKKYGVLVIALVREKELERATSICVKAYHDEPSAVAASLIAEVAIMQADVPLPENASQIIKEALTKFSDSAELLDAMGTWQLMQSRLPEAVSFYEMAEKLDPKRRRTLNNLAMALSEMSGKKQDSLMWIEKAIQIYGRDPDLLDTLGQVYFRNGRFKEALDTLIEASSRKEDVTFRIHLAQVHLAREDLSAAKEQWEIIKQSNTEDAVLTPRDKEFLGKLNTQFGDNL